MMHPDEKPDIAAGDPEVRIGESPISSLLAHYFHFEETLGMNVARGAIRSLPRPHHHSPVPGTGHQPTMIIPRYDEMSAEVSVASVEGDKSADASAPRYRGRRIAVVVPAYNEELLIGETLQSIPGFVEKIYAVDDCSKDRTLSIIQEYAKKDPRITPFHHEKNRGVGAAIVTGYKAALSDGIEIAAVMAGDNQMDPQILPMLLDPIIDGRCDYSVGNRLLSPAFRQGMSTWRFIGNSILTLLTKIASGYWQMMDPQNGYTAISARALERIGLDHIYPRYGYCNDIMVRLNVCGFRMCNIPHPAKYGREKSGIKYSSYIFKVSWLLLKDFLWRLKVKYIVLGFHPLVFYYLMGAVLTIASLFGGAYSLYYKFVQGYPIFVPAIASLILFGIGGQFILFAMMFDMQQEKNGGSGGWYLSGA